MSTFLSAQSKTYALIVGVSDYEKPGITDLEYAAKDALCFYDFLVKEQGVDSNNIELLLDSEATVGNIYSAKRIIESRIEKKDLVYFYFAGHGDVDSDFYKSGFFLAHDTPHKNYQNNAIEMLHINKMANTLSLNKKANVILITDACRSGNITGVDNIGEKLLVESHLMEAKKREIRMASCQPHQLSQENEVWGGGRGAFSYYLIRGLQGKADANEDGKVTMKELSRFLTIKVEDDMFEFNLPAQTPNFDGKESTKLSKVNPNILSQLDNPEGGNFAGGSRALGGVAKSKMQQLFDEMEENFFKQNRDFTPFLFMPAEEFVEQILNETIFDQNGQDKEGFEEKKAEYEEILDLIKNDEEQRFAFRHGFVASAHNIVQEAINLYLEADEKEFERRKFYDSDVSYFDNLASLCDLGNYVMNDTECELYHIFTVKKLYFKGIAARLKCNNKGANRDSLIDVAFKYQTKAAAYDPNTAYIQNELGILNEHQKKYEASKKHYERAIELVPNWAYPYSNLSRLSNSMANFEDGIKYANISLRLKPNFSLAYIGLGENALSLGDRLLAKEALLKAVNLDDKIQSSYELLGRLSVDLGEYEDANWFFTRVEKDLDVSDTDADATSGSLNREPHLETAATTAMYSFGFGDLNYDTLDQNSVIHLTILGDYYSDVNYYFKALKIDSTNAMTFYKIAKHYQSSQEDLSSALYYYKKAEELSMSISTFEQKCIDYMLLIPVGNSIGLKYKSEFVPVEKISELLIYYYNLNGWTEEVDELFEKLIKLNNYSTDDIATFANHYKDRGQYWKAEAILKEAAKINPEFAYHQLKELYQYCINNKIKADFYNGKIAFLIIEKLNPNFFKGNLPVHDLMLSEKAVNDRVLKIDNSDGVILDPDEYWSAMNYLSAIDPISVYYDEFRVAEYLAIFYNKTKNYVTSQKYALEALNRDNPSVWVTLVAADNYLNQIFFTKAYELLRGLHEQNKLSYKYYDKLYRLALLAGEYDIAERALATVKNVTQENLYLQRALLYKLSERDTLATIEYEKAYNEDPTNPYIAYDISKIYHKLGDKQASFNWFGRALNNSIFKVPLVLRRDILAKRYILKFGLLTRDVFSGMNRT